MSELALEYFVQAVEGSEHDLPGVARCVQLQLLVESLGGKCPQLLDLGVELRELGSGICHHVGVLLSPGFSLSRSQWPLLLLLWELLTLLW